jgi:pimeloyl-ACP methyl ester carboxylesterase
VDASSPVASNPGSFPVDAPQEGAALSSLAVPPKSPARRATYEIQCPASGWNGTLFQYSHGYVVPGSANPAHDADDPVTGAWLLGHGYALAGSSYATTGWAIQQALPDQIATLDTFDSTYGTTEATIAWGHSLGGIITAGLIQDYPGRFTAALPVCGVLSGGWPPGIPHWTRVCVPEADRSFGPGRQHHQPQRQPGERRGRGGPGAADGDISVPVLTMHTTGDGLVAPMTSRAPGAWRRASRRGGCW